MFLVPVAVVGYSMWEKRKKQEVEASKLLGRTLSPNGAVVVDNNKDDGDESSSSPSATAVLELIGSSVTSDSMETLSLGGCTRAGAATDAIHHNTLPNENSMIDTTNEASGPLDSLIVNERDDEKEEKTSDLDDAEEESADPTAETEEIRPWQGLVRFVQDQRKRWQDDDERRRIKTNEEALTYEVLGHQGEYALPFPKISFK